MRKLVHCGAAIAPPAYRARVSCASNAPRVTAAMPELPEVETVRRGLAPGDGGRAASSGSRCARPDLRWPLPPGFARLTGRRVVGSAGGPNICWSISTTATCCSCISACRARSGRARTPSPASISTSAPRAPAHDHVVLDMSNGGTRDLQRPAPLRLMELAPAPSWTHIRCSRLGPEPLGQRLRRRVLAAWPARRPRSRRRCSTSASSPASATSMSARRFFARGSRRAAGLDHRRRNGRRTRAQSRWSTAIRRCSPRRSRPAALACATTASRRRARLFPARLPVYGREGEPCPRCARQSSASCSPAARHSIVRCQMRPERRASRVILADESNQPERTDMAYENIIVETKGRVGIIRLNRPQALNALNTRADRRAGAGDRGLSRPTTPSAP